MPPIDRICRIRQRCFGKTDEALCGLQLRAGRLESRQSELANMICFLYLRCPKSEMSRKLFRSGTRHPGLGRELSPTILFRVLLLVSHPKLFSGSHEAIINCAQIAARAAVRAAAPWLRHLQQIEVALYLGWVFELLHSPFSKGKCVLVGFELLGFAVSLAAG